MSLREERIAVGISAAALVTSLAVGYFNYHFTAEQVDIQRGQLRVAQDQLAEAQREGPKLQLAARLAVYRPDGVWLSIKDGEFVTSDRAQAGNVVGVVDVENKSPRYNAVIKTLGVGVSATQYRAAQRVNCDRGDGKGIVACRLPISLGPQSKFAFFVDLNREPLKSALTCNKYNDGGVELFLEEMSTGRYAARTNQKVFYTRDCPS